MSYLVLVRKYRPQTFEDMVGQKSSAKTLKNAILRDSVAHAYLFTGSRGTGKTSMARIFSKALNCPNVKDAEPCNECEICRGISAGTDVDVIEIDGASNNSVNDVRDLREAVRYVPQRAKYKIYIIDEVHMLSGSAFNALLKTLEEPPDHVKFILATTESHKIPETIHSRCQRFDFKRITPKDIAERLEQIAKAESIPVEPGVLGTIAQSTRGGMRDSISLLDQLASFREGEKITVAEMNELLGRAGSERMGELFDALKKGDATGVLETVDEVSMTRDLAVFVEEAVMFARNALILKTCGEKTAMLDAIRSEIEPYKKAAENFSEDTLLYVIEVLSTLKNRMRYETDKRTPVETVLLKLSRLEDLTPVGELIARMEKIAVGRPATTASPRSGESAKKKPAPEPVETVRGAVSLYDTDGWWPGLIEKAENERSGLAPLLNINCRPEVEKGLLRLRVGSPMQVEKLGETETRKFVRELVEELTGEKVKLELKLDENKSVKEESALKEHPFVKKLTDNFNARIMEN